MKREPEGRRVTQETAAFPESEPAHIVIGMKLAREHFQGRGCDAQGFTKLTEVELSALLALAAQLGSARRDA